MAVYWSLAMADRINLLVEAKTPARKFAPQ
jgi:hypothetical protein